MRSSGRVVEAPDLQDYLEDLLCRLDAAFCSDVRLYVVRVPHFNATMAPNGAMHIWTGTLLRMENEAQLAHVLGHELVHFKKRHSLKQWQKLARQAGRRGDRASARRRGRRELGSPSPLPPASIASRASKSAKRISWASRW